MTMVAVPEFSKQGLIKMSRMSQLLFDLFILSGLRLKTFYFLASRFQFVNKVQPGFVSYPQCQNLRNHLLYLIQERGNCPSNSVER